MHRLLGDHRLSILVGSGVVGGDVSLCGRHHTLGGEGVGYLAHHRAGGREGDRAGERLLDHAPALHLEA